MLLSFSRNAAIWFNGCMGGKMRVFRRHLFLLSGLLTLCLFFLVAGLDRAGKTETAHALAGPMRVLILPMYLVWMVITIVQVAIGGPVGLPGPFGAIVSGISLAAGLAPYAFADYVLDRWRQVATRKVSASDSPDALNARLDASRKEGRSE
jgi:H+/Cl- antiporter ClcA